MARMTNALPDDTLETLWHRLRHGSSHPPPGDSWRVHIDGHPCGWAAPDVARALLDIAEGDHTSQMLYLPGGNRNLARVAQYLSERHLLKGWRDELLDVHDEAGECLGAIERAVMRPLGLATHAVHLNAYAPDGTIWIARRAAHKNTDPGKWDTLVGGLVASGETPNDALLRESNEEAGLLPEHLIRLRSAGSFVVRRIVPEGYQVEHTWVSECVLPPGFTPTNLDGEVDLIRQATPEEVIDMIAHDEFTAEAALSILLSLGCPPASGR